VNSRPLPRTQLAEEAVLLGPADRLLTAEEEIHLGKQFQAARRELLVWVVGTPVGARELSELAEGVRVGELHLSSLIDIDAAAANLPEAQRTGRLRVSHSARYFQARVRDLLRLHEQSADLGEANGQRSKRRRRERLARLGASLHLRDDALCELAERVKTGYPEDHEAHRAIVDAQTRGNRAREEFVQCNVRLVVALAKRFVGRGLSLGDLVQEGNIGLMRAVEKFDPSRGYRFSTYGAWWIRQAMARALSNQSRTIRIPVHAIELQRQLARARHACEQQTGAPATVAELSEKTGLAPHKVEAFTNLVPEPLSLDAPASCEGDARLGDFVADGGDGPAEQALGRDLAEHVHALLETLPERERMILRRRFGLDGRGTRTLQEIGEAAGVSRERIRQLEVEALRKLRRLAPKVLREIVK
jgi:RNA polymerase primary sigma factor